MEGGKKGGYGREYEPDTREGVSEDVGPDYASVGGGEVYGGVSMFPDHSEVAAGELPSVTNDRLHEQVEPVGLDNTPEGFSGVEDAPLHREPDRPTIPPPPLEKGGQDKRAPEVLTPHAYTVLLEKYLKDFKPGVIPPSWDFDKHGYVKGPSGTTYPQAFFRQYEKEAQSILDGDSSSPHGSLEREKFFERIARMFALPTRSLKKRDSDSE